MSAARKPALPVVHGHIAVYRVDADAVSILHVFHTAQDWQAKLAEERSDR